jgi:hypothetical protein
MLKMLLEMLRKDSVIDEHPIYKELSADETVRRRKAQRTGRLKHPIKPDQRSKPVLVPKRNKDATGVMI